MDAVAQLALMTKAKLAFEEDDTFLCFPGLVPLTYPTDRLRLSDSETTTATDLAERVEFSRIVNQVPRGPLVGAFLEEENLPVIYKEVLETARLASGVLTPDEVEHLERTRKFLYEEGPHGFRQPGPTYQRYNQYRDAHIKAEEAYGVGALKARMTTDPFERARWEEIDEPRLRAEVARAEREWITLGFRNEIDAALQVETSYAARNPAGAWADWRKDFIEALDTETDTNLNETAHTTFSPSNVFDLEWERFELSRNEIEALVQQAPESLKDLFSVDFGLSNIESLSFEYRSAGVTRPWFKPAVFKSRFWRLPPGSAMLAEGERLENGRCPAYIAALVFARKIEVQTRDQSKPVAVDPRVVFQLQATTIKPQFAAVAKKLQLQRTAMFAAAATPSVAVHTATASAPARRVLMHAAMAAPAAAPARARIRDHRLRAATFSATATRIWNPDLILTRPDPVTPDPVPPDPTPPPAEDEVTVLAFICKQLPPVVPNPDMTLTWA